MIILSDYLKQKHFYADDELDDLLANCYFHPSRDKKYFRKSIKHFAHYAMRLLWNTRELNLLGKGYGNRDIRRIMIEEMVPEDLDFAITLYCSYLPKTTSNTINVLAFLIFVSVMIRNDTVNALFKSSPVGKHEKFLSLPYKKIIIVSSGHQRYWRASS